MSGIKPRISGAGSDRHNHCTKNEELLARFLFANFCLSISSVLHT